MDGTLTNTTTPGQGGTVSNGNEGIFNTGELDPHH